MIAMVKKKLWCVWLIAFQNKDTLKFVTHLLDREVFDHLSPACLLLYNLLYQIN